jgi:hypothetical protein
LPLKHQKLGQYASAFGVVCLGVLAFDRKLLIIFNELFLVKFWHTACLVLGMQTLQLSEQHFLKLAKELQGNGATAALETLRTYLGVNAQLLRACESLPQNSESESSATARFSLRKVNKHFLAALNNREWHIRSSTQGMRRSAGFNRIPVRRALKQKRLRQIIGE